MYALNARSCRSHSTFKPVLKVIYEEQPPERPSSLYEQAIIAQFSYWAV
jgi:hypothetical protein